MQLAVCPYCTNIYNQATKKWLGDLPIKLTETNHYYHLCTECAKERGVDYYEV